MRIQGRLRMIIQGYVGTAPEAISTPDTTEEGCKTGSPKTLQDEPQLCPKGQGGYR